MVGTFYRAPAPDKPPFVEVGQSVEPDTIVCIIEVMKLMNSIEAGVRGVVKEIAVQNGTAVEHGEVLMGIEPR
jgi:acetyl-CoA carboxylase biotin carboxyl carrier protein